jgi:tight adherence protein B
MQMAKLAALLESGVNLKTSLNEVGLSEFPDQLKLAISLGAPLVPLLRSLNQLEQNRLRAQGELEQALAIPRATRKLLAWLPLITLFLSVAAGLVSIEALLSPISLACLLIGFGLIFLGLWLTKRMLQQVRGDFSLRELQDFSIAISSGLTLATIERLFPDLLRNDSVDRLTKLSQKTGARLSGLVASEIESSLSQQLSQKISDLRRLSVRILIPLGLTTLPAFMLFILPPIVVGFTK